LKQICLAAHNYESANGVLPPGNLGGDKNPTPAGPGLGFFNGQCVGTLYFLLPYLEQNNISSQMSGQYNVTAGWAFTPSAPQWWSGPSTAMDWSMGWAKIKMFKCPSDPITSASGSTNGAILFMMPDPSTPGTNACTYGWFTNGNQYDLGLSNYTSVAGALGDNVHTASPSDGPGVNLQAFRGIYYNRSKTTTVGISDGSSNTLAFGETLGRSVGLASPDFSGLAWIGAGGMPTKFGMQNGKSGTGGSSASVPLCFGSMHTNTVNFAFGDGSVRGLRPGQTGVRNPLPGYPAMTADWAVYQQMAGANDGAVWASGQLTN